MTKFFPKLNAAPRRSIIPNENFGSRIPKIFHQTYRDKTLPLPLAQNREKIIAMNPGWDCRLHDDNDINGFILKNYGARVLKQFQRIRPEYGAARADFFRYLLLYKVGGIYLDVKAAPDLPFDTILRDDDRFLLSHWSNNKKDEEYEGYGMHPELGPDGELQQWLIIGAPGHPYMKAVIDTILQNIDRYFPSLHGVGRHGVLQLTGPITYTHAINRILREHPHRFVDSTRELAIRYSIMPKAQHKELFQNKHYTQLTSPIVQLGVHKKVADPILGMLRDWRRNMKSAPKSHA